MKNRFNNFIKTPLLFLLCAVLFIQCDKDETPAQLENLDAKFTNSADLSIFKAAVARAKLETFTKGPGPFTIFAPTDAAFTAAGISAANLGSIDSITLTALLLNHFQNIKRTSFEIPEGPNGPMASIAGFNNYSYQNKPLGKIYISGANIIERDIVCSNGIFHKIDRLLAPPTLTTSVILAANSNYSLMVQAIAKAGLTTTFSPSTAAPATIFALSNTIMTANGYDAVTIAALTGPALTTLSNILKYHVVASRNFSTDVKAGNLKTVLGSNVIISNSTGIFVKGISNPTAFQLNPVDAVATNGVIHAIAGMLKP